MDKECQTSQIKRLKTSDLTFYFRLRNLTYVRSNGEGTILKLVCLMINFFSLSSLFFHFVYEREIKFEEEGRSSINGKRVEKNKKNEK